MARRPSSKPPAAPALAQADEHGVAIKRDGKGRIVPRASDGTTLGDRIRAARAAVVPPLTQEDIANAFEITPNAVTNWENDTSRPGGRKFARLAELLRTDLKQLLAGPPAPAAEDDARDIAEIIPNAMPVQTGGRDLPVMGKAQGGSEGWLTMGETPFDWTVRPSALLKIKDAYALIVEGDSMTDFGLPDGTVMHVHPHRAPKPGGFCVLVKRNGDAFVKRYIAHRGARFVVEQSNPRQTLEFPDGEVRAVHRVTGVSYDG